MKTFRGVILGICVAISISVFAASLWPNGPWLETFQNGFLFGNGSIFSALNSVPKFDDRRLDDRNKDLYFQEDFEDGSVSFTCGGNLTATDETGSPIAGSTSKLITQAAGALNQVCESAAIMLDEKQKDALNQVCINAIGENFDLVAYDSTNANELGRISIEDTSKTYCLEFLTIASTNAITYRLEAVNEVVSSTLKYDDVQFKTNPLNAAQVFASTEWEAYTPTITGFGTTSSEDFKYRRLGDTIEVEGYFVSGTSTATEAQITLPNGYTIKQGALQNVGTWARDVAAGSSELGGFVLATSGDSFINLGDRGTFASSGTNPDAVDAAVGSRVVVSGNGVSLKYSVSVNELSNTFKSIVTNSGEVETEDFFVNDVAGRVSSGEIYGVYFNSAGIQRNTISKLGTVTEGTSSTGAKFTANQKVKVTAYVGFENNTNTTGVSFSIDGDLTQAATAAANIDKIRGVQRQSDPGRTVTHSVSVVLEAGQSIAPHLENTVTLDASDNFGNVFGFTVEKATLGEYHLVPVSDQENVFSAYIEAADGSPEVITENSPWIDSITDNGVGDYTINFKAGFFTVAPSVTALAITTGTSGLIQIQGSVSTSSVRIETINVSGVNQERDFYIAVQKQGADYQEPKVFLGNVPVNYTQTKELTVSSNSNQDISELQFNNLVVGRMYQISGSVFLNSDSGNQNIVTFRSASGGTGTEYEQLRFEGNDGVNDQARFGVNYKFKAVSSTLYVNHNGGDTFSAGSKIQLTELNHTRETSRF